MAEIEIIKQGLKCERCGKEWIPRIPKDMVRICPKCKSIRWDKPRITSKSLQKDTNEVPEI